MKHQSDRRTRTFAIIFATTLISALVFALAPSAMAQTTVSQCNGTDNVGGQAVECHYTITNNVDGNDTSSTVTLNECHGAANDPPTMTCIPSTTMSSQLVTSVDQCNGSGNGGGGTVECTVQVTNNITGTMSSVAATVNQCNASGTGGGTAPTVLCDPLPANTTGATVDQCNGSGTGGGGTVRVQCTVDRASTATSIVDVTINQCNGSGNGGGATVTCSAVLSNVITAPAPGPSASPTAGGGGNGGGGDSGGIDTGQVSRVPVGGVAAGGGSTSGFENMNLLVVGLALIGAAVATLLIRRRSKVKA
ncbi:MAG: hypothetical protein QOG04_895 [Actinomycetota bacterium]|jgi:hypothetical protein|nr:hypothetical protein [Actinomycetota bacterium]